MNANEVEARFLRLNKILGFAAGVWPFQKDSTKKLSRLLVTLAITSCLATQYARLIVHHRLEIVLKDYPNIAVSTGMVLKFSNYIINESKLKILLEGIYDDWTTIRSMDEYRIMVKYAERGVYVAVFYLVHVFGCLILFLSLPAVPSILDMLIPLNETRARIYLYPAYYFVDMEKYYSIILAHMAIVVIVISIVYCACDMNYIYTIQHACGLLAVSGHRFRHACCDSTDKEEENLAELMHSTYKNVCRSIHAHQRALQYVKQIETTHETCLFISVVIVMTTITLTLLSISEREHDAEWFVYCGFFFSQLFHILFLTIQGQFLVNSYDRLFVMICQAMWYNSACETQALYALALRRCLNPPLLTAGGFVTLNLRTFAEIVKASVSYYTVFGGN